jgi:hypothetical protein
MFDSRPARALTREVLAMTPGTTQFVERVRAITLYLDAEQARLERRIHEPTPAASGRVSESATPSEEEPGTT